jgi:hypothetical protein
MEEAEQDADRRRLARAVGPEEPVHLAGLDAQVQPVERAGGTEGLDEAGDVDRGCHDSPGYTCFTNL